MTDTYRIIATVKSELAKPDERVGRPISLRAVFVGWLVFLLIGVFGMIRFGVLG